MNSEFPSIQIPEVLSRLCSMTMTNSRKCFSEISDLVEKDKFLKIYVKDVFSPYLQKGGILGMLSALGWDGFRNRLAEAYIYYARYGTYPQTIEIDEVNDVLDIERRFDFIYSENNSRVFMLGFYLKLCEIYYENSDEFQEQEFINIPLAVDEILISGHSKGLYPDWLILTVWSMFQIIGVEQTILILRVSKGKISRVINEMSLGHYEDLIKALLKYGQAIGDKEFFVEEKI